MNLLDLAVRVKCEDEATSALSGLSMRTIAIGNAMGNAMYDAARQAVDAIAEVGKSALDAYASYEQLVGGMETLFKESADEVVANAQKAYATAGMSANQYMESVTIFASALIQSASRGAKTVTEADTKAMTDALDKQYTASQRAMDRQYTLYQRSLDKQVKAVEKSNEQKLEKLEKAHEREVESFEKATEKKIRLMERQYQRSLYYIDKDEAARIKSIDDEIDRLNGLTEAEDKAERDRANAEKRAELEKAVQRAKTNKKRRAAQEELDDFLANLEKEQRQEQRREEIERLKESKDAVKESADSERDELKKKHDKELEQVKTARSAQLKAIQEANQRESKALREAQSEQLARLRESNADKLKAMKQHQQDELAVLKKSMAEQKKVIASGGEDDFVKATAADRKKAAEQADLAMRDISDNVNKMGTNMESIQMAYRGFSRSNFTMLDNLSIGYGGTRSEMQRLLKDAERIKASQGETTKYSIDSFGDIVEAIHTVQTEMGISGISAEEAAEAVKNGTMTQAEAYEAMGTTAKESQTTIEGSMNSLKGAWENWLASLGDSNADVSEKTDQLVEAAMVAAGNIVPRIGTILESAGAIVAEKAPEVFGKIGEALMNALPEDVRKQFEEKLGILKLAFDTFLAPAIKRVQKAFANLDKAIEPLKEPMGYIAAFIGDVLIFVLGALVDAFGFVVNIVAEVIRFVTNLDKHIENAGNVIGGFVKWVGEQFGKFGKAASSAIGGVIKWFTGLPGRILKAIGDAGSMLFNVGKDIVQGLINGIKDMASNIGDALLGGINDAVEAGKRFLGIASPSKLFKEMGGYTMEGFALGIEGSASRPQAAMLKAAEGVYGAADGTVTVGGAARGSGVTSGIVFSGNTFIVREEADIKRVAEQLHTLILRETGANPWKQSYMTA